LKLVRILSCLLIRCIQIGYEIMPKNKGKENNKTKLLIIRVKDNGVIRGLDWRTGFVNGKDNLPTTVFPMKIGKA
jgi:hypothetical protein